MWRSCVFTRALGFVACESTSMSPSPPRFVDSMARNAPWRCSCATLHGTRGRLRTTTVDLNRTTTTSLFALARAISAFSSFLSLSLSFDRFAFWLPRDAEDEEADDGGAGGFSLRSSLMMSTDIWRINRCVFARRTRTRTETKR